MGVIILLKLQCNPISHIDQNSQKHTCGLAVPQRRSHEAHRAAPVHGTSRHIERESSDHIIHQDAKVISQVCACNAEGPHGGEDEDIAAGEEGKGEGLSKRIGCDFGVGGLVFEGAGVAIHLLDLA